MKVVGLITEYNPLHNGHAYHLQQAKMVTGADYVVVVMSGNFVQRGTPALMDKYARTKMALECGADIVFELPVCFACASAEYFAHGAVSLLDKLGIVDSICFGSESGDIKDLVDIATLLNQESDEFREALQLGVKSGKSFPMARMEALSSSMSTPKHALLSSPNNTLGIEYIKALQHFNSSITPITITRQVADYHKEELTKAQGNAISSATAIRKNLTDLASLEQLKNHVPDYVYFAMKENFEKTFPVSESDFSALLNYRLLFQGDTALYEYLDVNQDLSNRIMKYVGKNISYGDLALGLKSRQWTLTRINRALLHILLDIRSDHMLEYKEAGYAQYARILGLKKESSHLLRSITNYERIPVITKMSQAKKKLSPLALRMLQKDIHATTLYNQVVYQKYQTQLPDEYTNGIILT